MDGLARELRRGPGMKLHLGLLPCALAGASFCFSIPASAQGPETTWVQTPASAPAPAPALPLAPAPAAVAVPAPSDASAGCRLTSSQGVNPGDADTATRLLCSEIVQAGASQGSRYRVAFGSLGSLIIVSV